MRLLIVSHVTHFRSCGRLYAYGPYAREIDVWADLFTHVVIAAPCREEAPPNDCLPLTRDNILVAPQLETGGDTIKSRLIQFALLPLHVWNLSRAMRNADAIHVRCPGNLGLLGVLLAPLFSRRLVAKYAGQWNLFDGEPLAWRLQKSLLKSRWWRGPVTVYGHWGGQPEHIVPFFNSVMSEDQVRRARAAANRKRFNVPLKALFVGRLSASKNVRMLISAIGKLRDEGLVMHATIVGDGPEGDALIAQVKALGLETAIEFTGAVDFDQVLVFYEQADVLVLVSKTEGWPKTLLEGMAFGLVCIGAKLGAVPEILGEGRGFLISPDNEAELKDTLAQIVSKPEHFQAMFRAAAPWAQSYSLEGLREALRELLTLRWN